MRYPATSFSGFVAKNIEIVVGVAASVIAEGALGANVSFGTTSTTFDSRLSIGSPPCAYGNGSDKIELRFLELEELVVERATRNGSLVQEFPRDFI
jgi:hypothetical protein